METKHTPIPYYLGINPLMVKTRNGLRIAKIPTLHEHGEREADDYNIEMANAEFIVRACNNHDTLVEALEWALNRMNAEAGWLEKADYPARFMVDRAERIDEVQKTLAKAKGNDHERHPFDS